MDDKRIVEEISFDEPVVPEPDVPAESEPEFYTISEAATLLDMTYDAVYRRVNRKSLRAEMVDGVWLISSVDLHEIRHVRSTNGINRVTANVSNELYAVLKAHGHKINQSALFEAGMWMLLAEFVPDVSYEYATNQARKSIGQSEIINSASETLTAILG